MTNFNMGIGLGMAPAMRTNYPKNGQGGRAPKNHPPITLPTPLPIVRKRSVKFVDIPSIIE